jgi:hypothetical protein
MKTEKEFDAVKVMREIRDEISREIQGMSFEQEKEYIEKHLRSRRKPRTSKRRFDARPQSQSL